VFDCVLFLFSLWYLFLMVTVVWSVCECVCVCVCECECVRLSVCVFLPGLGGISAFIVF